MIRYLCVFFLFISVYLQPQLLHAQNDNVTIMDLVRKFQMLLHESRNKGVDASEAMELDKKSREAMQSGKREDAAKFLKEAISALEGKGLRVSEQEGHQGRPPMSGPPDGMKPPTGGPAAGNAGMMTPPADEPAKYSVAAESFDSPFGVFGPYEFEVDNKHEGITKDDANRYLHDIGAKWVQVKYWDENSVSQDINTYGRIGGEGRVESTNVIDAYRKELREVMRRHKKRTKYWEVGTEPNGFPPPRGWKGRPDAYAEFLKETYQVIKSECSDCMVIFGGLGGIGTKTGDESVSAVFLKDVLKAGGGKYIDGFAFKQHRYDAKDYKIIKKRMDDYVKIFSDFGINLRNMPVFLETATHDGYPKSTSGFLASFPVSQQSEREQAAGLFKIYIYSLAQGVKKIFWNLMYERYNFANDPGSDFNYYGLVNNPFNDGEKHPKLAYFTYKKMTEVLESSNWKNIQTVSENTAIIYKFKKGDRSVWVAWNDSGKSERIFIPGVNAKKVKVTEAVPNRETGKEISDYQNSFVTKVIISKEGSVKVEVGQVPLIIEEVI